jgi:uncharacterized protein with GYD domain
MSYQCRYVLSLPAWQSIAGAERRAFMPTYITLLRYTQQGVETMKQSPTRLEAAKQSVHQLGGEIKAFYLVMGQYDAVLISEAPDDETATKFALATAARGFVRTETLRAYPEEEYRRIIAGLP